MPNYPLTNPAEIAKLPPAHYLCVDGTIASQDSHGWSVQGLGPLLSDDAIVRCHGGIAARLVPETSPEEIMAAKRHTDEWKRKREDANRAGWNAEELLEQADAQRDQVMELLRQAEDFIKQDHTCDEDGVKRFGRGYCDIHDLIADIATFLAEQETNDE